MQVGTHRRLLSCFLLYFQNTTTLNAAVRAWLHEYVSSRTFPLKLTFSLSSLVTVPPCNCLQGKKLIWTFFVYQSLLFCIFRVVLSFFVRHFLHFINSHGRCMLQVFGKNIWLSFNDLKLSYTYSVCSEKEILYQLESCNAIFLEKPNKKESYSTFYINITCFMQL